MLKDNLKDSYSMNDWNEKDEDLFDLLREKDMEKSRTYYILMSEWHYPSGDGREYIRTYDTEESAARAAYGAVKAEEYNFVHECGYVVPSIKNVGGDGTYTGLLMRDRKGRNEWWYGVKVIVMRHGFDT